MKKQSRHFMLFAVIFVTVIIATTLTGCDFFNKLFHKEEQEQKPFVIGVISDCQIVAESDVGDDDYLAFQDLNEVGQKMLFISESILKTAVDRLIEQKVDVVFLPGDMTENGSKAGHEVVARECQRLLDAGIPTYVVCGNHDINKTPKKFYGSVSSALADGNYQTKAEANANGLNYNYINEVFSDGSCSVRCSGVTPQQFMSIYNNFGFKDALALDQLSEGYITTIEEEDYTFTEVGTMSYVQDLAGSNYRLITLDAANYYEDKNEDTYYMCQYGNNDEYDIQGTGYSAVTDRLLTWLETQLKTATTDGKKPLVMLHFPINGQMGDVVDSIDIGDNKINRQKEVQELLTTYGVEYVFTGHLHTQHVATYTDSLTGNTLTDIETGCLTNYALPIRYVTTELDGTVKIENEYLSKVNENYVPDYVSEEIKARVTTDIQSYALEFVYNNLLTNFDNRINEEEEKYSLFYDIFEMLQLDPEEKRSTDTKLNNLASYLYNDIYKGFLTMPVNKTEGKISVQSICEKYNVTLPQTTYKDVFTAVCGIIGKVYKGDFSEAGSEITYTSTDGTLLRYIVYSAFEYLRTSELFTKLNGINNSIATDTISEGFVAKLFNEGKLDLMKDGFLEKALTIINPVIEDKTPLSLEGMDMATVVQTLTNFNLVALGAKILPKYCDVENKTIFGIKINDLIRMEVVDDVPYLELNMNLLFEKVIYGVVGKDLLY